MLSPPSQDTPPSDRTRWFLDEIHAHEASLRSYLRACFPGNRDVDDVVQESYLRIWKARAIRPIESAKSFLFQVARHIAIDSVRRHRVCPIQPVTEIAALSVLDEGPGAVETVCHRERIALLAAAIDTLPARCREIVILRKLRGVSQNAIAAQLGISVQTVQVQVHRGVKRIARHLAEHPAHREP